MPQSAGYDLYSVEDVCIMPRSAKLLRTDTGFKSPRGYFGKIKARCSLALRFANVGGSIIDAGYRGPVGVIFFNFSDKNIWIGEGERIGQIVFQRIATNLTLSEVSDFEERRPFAAAKVFDLQI